MKWLFCCFVFYLIVVWVSMMFVFFVLWLMFGDPVAVMFVCFQGKFIFEVIDLLCEVFGFIDVFFYL